MVLLWEIQVNVEKENHLRVYISVIRLVIFSTIIFFALNLKLNLKRLWLAITICVIVNYFIVTWIDPKTEVNLFYSILYGIIIGLITAYYKADSSLSYLANQLESYGSKESNNLWNLQNFRNLWIQTFYSERLKFIFLAVSAIIGISILIVISSLHLFKFLNKEDFENLRECAEIACVLDSLQSHHNLE